VATYPVRADPAPTEFHELPPDALGNQGTACPKAARLVPIRPDWRLLARSTSLTN
jgi:hypothetical protein